jgi:hypothetical protein
MTKCIGCKQNFKVQGYPAHKKSCKPYQREIRARLANISNLDLIPGPSVIPHDTQAGEPENPGDMLVDEIQVRNRQ